jgi:adenosylhomocysteine nucleosidase
MHEELRALVPTLKEPHTVVIAGRRFHTGTLDGHPVVLALSGIGKVAASVTASLLLTEFDVAAIVLTGVAAGIGRGVRVGDVVVARQLVQHDMDASPLFPRFEVPLTGIARFEADAGLSHALATSALRCMAHAGELLGEAHLADFDIDSPAVHEGLLATGDRLVTTAADAEALAQLLPEALAVEMEGAALAQVCTDFSRPFAVVRTVCDRADAETHADLTRFVIDVASVYTRVIVHDWLRSRS